MSNFSVGHNCFQNASAGGKRLTTTKFSSLYDFYETATCVQHPHFDSPFGGCLRQVCLYILTDVAVERETEGDLVLGDMGEGMAFRPGAFDGVIRY